MMMRFPDEILAIIFNNLEGLADQARFSLVSNSWRRVAVQENLRQPAWLLIPSDALKNKEKHVNFFDMFSGNLHSFELPNPLNEGIIHGCSKGWLVISRPPQLFLFNPLTRFHIKLPSMDTIPAYSQFLVDNENDLDLSPFVIINRVELSSANLDCTVAMLSDSGEIAICTPYSDTWIAFPNRDLSFCDILFCGSTLYALAIDPAIEPRPDYQILECGDELIILKTVSIHSLISLLCSQTEPDISYETLDYSFLAEEEIFPKMVLNKDGELLMVCRTKHCFTAKMEDHDGVSVLDYLQSSKMIVFKLKPAKEASLGWSATKVDDLGDQILFVAPYGSTSVPLCKELRARGWTSNCIYFADIADDYLSSYRPLVSREMGVFHLKDNTIKRPFPSITCPIECPSMWFTPKPT